MADQYTIHAATLIRLQLAVTALQAVSGPINDLQANLREMASRDPENANLAEEAARLDGLPSIVSAALQIAFGARTKIPEELHTGVYSLRMEIDTAERFLEQVQS